MGILYTKAVKGPAELGIWKITESPDELLGQITLSQAEQQLYSTFRTEWRQKQWLSYRRLIREIISPQQYPVHYDESGKPFLAGSDWHISATHTEEYAGVIISRHVKVGIDMEKIRPRIEKVKEKFMSEGELADIPPESWLEGLTLSWCAKESLYKLYGQRNLDFRKNIRIFLPLHNEEKKFTGEIILPDQCVVFTLHYEIRDDLVVVWATEKTGDRHGKPDS